MKKLNHLYKKLFFILIFVFFIIPKIVFSEISIDEKLKKLTLELRCMTCQNQSVYDSDSDFAKDITKIVEKMIKEGKNENDIKLFLVDRYGEYILFKPMLDNKNLILWLFPFILFLIFLVFFANRLKKNRL